MPQFRSMMVYLDFTKLRKNMAYAHDVMAPYDAPKQLMAQRPSCCTKQILCEINSFSFVSILFNTFASVLGTRVKTRYRLVLNYVSSAFGIFQHVFRGMDSKQREDRCLRHTSSRSQNVSDFHWKQHKYSRII